MKQNELLKKFEIEELEQRYEMGWRASKTEVKVHTDSGTFHFDSSKL